MADDDLNMEYSHCWGPVDSETKNCKSYDGPQETCMTVKSCHTKTNISNFFHTCIDGKQRISSSIGKT